jgi:hypothetical protein
MQDNEPRRIEGEQAMQVGLRFSRTQVSHKVQLRISTQAGKWPLSHPKTLSSISLVQSRCGPFDVPDCSEM